MAQTPPRQTQAPTAGANGTQAKGNTKNAFGFNPQMGFTVNVNANRQTNGVPGQGGRPSENPKTPSGMLPAPEFASPAQVREYCNSVRAAMAMMAFELAMGAEIMKATLAQVPDSEGRIGASKVRAWKVARKLSKSADAALDAAKNAAATYAAFQREYEEEINRVRHHARRPQARRMDWTQQ
ncbi:plasmid transfer protein TraA [Streptomyces subrutilus]|uniref:plasmid transfer protein TraA n=1 Tax=Streptomyces subrutilus TaxID=36818 RepID=UPI002E164EA5|nr:sporulation protein SsgA [Streptomyces subrutilus]